MRIRIVAVGKLKQEYRPLQQEFLKRLKNRVEIVEVKEIGDVEKETKQLLNKVMEGSYVVACSHEGRQLTSDEFASFLKEKERITFLIGGPDGLDRNLLKKEVDLVLSLSKMVFNHQLFRIMLLEQIYRAVSSLEGKPYSKH